MLTIVAQQKTVRESWASQHLIQSQTQSLPTAHSPGKCHKNGPWKKLPLCHLPSLWYQLTHYT